MSNGAKGVISNRRIALIEHLSNEIAAQVNAMVAWRSRINFTAYFGPWIVFGAYVAVGGARPGWPTQDSSIGLLLVGLAIVYLLFGFGCARVEAGSREQCNSWRRLIANLYGGENVDVTEKKLEYGHNLIPNYLAVYALMLVAFILAVLVLNALTWTVPTP